MEKEFKCILIVDWKTGKIKINKLKPKKLTLTQIPIDFNLKIKIPEIPQLKARGEINLSQAKVNEIVIEEI